MTIERFYLACLSHASYIVADGGEAAVIDPQRDVNVYLDYLRRHGLTLKYVIETHLHADFVSGHLELARRTGAEVVIGHRAAAAFPHRGVVEGDELALGHVTLKIRETPGHTPEGITIEARNGRMPGEPVALFTGDTLFAGDVGRPDLLDAVGITKEDLGGMLYDSLREKIMAYPDETRIYPAHGAGSSCGKDLRDVEFSTIGAEKLTNYALQPMSREEFVRVVTQGQPEAPAYFSSDAGINRQGAPELGEVMAGVRRLSPAELADAVTHGAVLLDTRDPEEFSHGFIPGAVNIGLDGQFASWVGTLLPIGSPLVIVAPAGREDESVLRCARVGYDNVIGCLDGGFGAWRNEGRDVDDFGRVEPEELLRSMEGEPAPLVLDVRREGEHMAQSIPGAAFVTLSAIGRYAGSLKADGRPVIVHCAGGYRSAMAASILKKSGVADVRDLRGGLAAWKRQGLPVREQSVGEGLMDGR